jgi:hypothetical protein
VRETFTVHWPSQDIQKGMDNPEESVDDLKESVREQLYTQTREELLRVQLANAENYDKTILSLSTAALGFSLVFIKDIVPVIIGSWLLILSWWLFILAIIINIFSYIKSFFIIERQLKDVEKYYNYKSSKKDKEECLENSEKGCNFIIWLNTISGGFCILAIIVTVIFASINLKGDSSMSKESEKKIIRATGAIPPLKMQKITDGKTWIAVPPPSFRPLPQKTPEQSGSSGTNNTKPQSGTKSQPSGNSGKDK